MQESNVSTLREQVAASLREQIERGVYAPGERLPSLSQVCATHEVSNITARAAFKSLEDAGLIESRARAGYFVRRRAVVGSSGGKETVALLAPSCETAFFSLLSSGAEEAARAAGFRLVLAHCKGIWELEAQLLHELAGEVAGICVVPSNPSPRAYLELLERDVPFVFLDRQVEGLSASVVATDNEEAGALLTRHLLESGCERVVALVDYDGIASSQRERVRGVHRALQAAGKTPQNALYSPLGGEGAGILLARQFLGSWKRGERVGLVCSDELIAGGVYLALREAGVRVPHDIAVVAVGNFLAPHLDPPLTTVSQQLHLMGARAMELLIERVRFGAGAKPQTVLLEPHLTVRNSSDAASEFCRVTQILDNARVLNADLGIQKTAVLT